MYFGVHGTCGTSVPSESLFSKAGEVVAANLKPKNVDMILFLNEKVLCFGIGQWFIGFCGLFGEGGSIVRYRIVSVDHTNTQYRIESPLSGIAHL